MKKKVNILLAAYNGEKFIKEQIESILSQKTDGFELHLFVRDDGSTDKTLEILSEYESAGKLKVFTGENKGFAKNFLTLLQLCDEADYYAFSDHDDIWEEDKVLKGFKMLESQPEEDKTKPLLYFSNYEFYNDDMTSHTPHDMGKLTPNFANALLDCPALGCTQMFNNVARTEIIRQLPDYVVGHDCWTYMVCAGLGNAIYDPSVTMRFRRHPGSASAEGMSFFKLQFWRVRTYFKKDRFSVIRKMICNYKELFGDRLKPEDRELLDLYTNEKHTLSLGVKKAFHKGRFRPKMSDEIMLRMIALIGKV